MPHAAPGRQPDIPDPARRLGGGDGVRGDRRLGIVIRHLDRQRRVAEQHVVQRPERHPHGLTQQQRTKAGTVHEQIARHLPRLGRAHLADITTLGQHHLFDIGQHMPHPELFAAVAAQEVGELTRVQMVSVIGQRFIFRRRDRLGGEPGVANPPLRRHRVAEARLPLPRQPVRREIHLPEILRQHQRMVIAVLRRTGGPAIEPRTLFERGVAFAEKGRFRHPHRLQRGAQRRPGTLAHPDDRHIG